MKFKNYAPALLASGIVGFIFGIGAFSFYVNKPFEDMGNLPDWIGALTTIVAGIWAYLRFRKETAEKIINQPVALNWTIKPWRIKNDDSPDSNKYIPGYLVNVHNPTERPVHIKIGYMNIQSLGHGQGTQDMIEMNLNLGSYTLNFDEFAEFKISKNVLKSVIERDFVQDVKNSDNLFLLRPSVILSNDSTIYGSEDTILNLKTSDFI